MASPFRIFRKHQKGAFAFLTVMAMIAFLFLGGTSMIGQRGGKDPVVVRTTKFGNLTAYQVQSLLSQRSNLLSFLGTLSAEVQRAGGSDRNIRFIQAVIGPAAEQPVIEKWLFAKTAAEMGVAVDEKAIADFLDGLTEKRLTGAQIQQILQGLGKRGGMSEPQLFAILQDELLALRLRELFNETNPPNQLNWYSRTVPPGQRWDYFKRLNQFASIEAAVVPVDQYLNSKEMEPASDEQLKKFFEENKERVALPESPEPGFRQPRRASLQYLKAEESKFLAAVSEAEVKEQYEKDKERYDKIDEEFNKQSKIEPPKKTDAEKKTDTGKKPETEKKSPATPAEGTKGRGGEGEKKNATTPPPEKKDGADKAGKKPEDKKPDEKPAAAPKAGSSSRTPARSPFRLVSFAEDQAEKKNDKKATDAKPPADTKKVTDDKKDAEAKKAADDKKPADDKKAAEPKKAADDKKPVEDKKPADAKQSPDDKKPAAKAGAAAAPASEKPKGGLSDRVKERIRRELAQQKMAAALHDLHEQLAAYRVDWTKYDAESKRNKEIAQPVPPDFGAMAKKDGLIAGKTGLLAQNEIMHTDLGKSFTYARRGQGFAQISVTQTAFESHTLYQPELSMDESGNRYLYWKIEDVADRVLNYDDPGVADEVLRVWKQVHARKIAEAAAKKLKDEAVKAGKPLKEVFAGQTTKVVRPPRFSWLTFGFVPFELTTEALRPHMSEVEGVTSPGQDFMRTVFSLSPGQVGVAINQPQTDVYVVRMVDLTPYSELLKEFESGDPFSRYAAIALEDQQQIDHAWKESIKADAGFHWDKPQQKPGSQQPQQPEPVDYEE